MKKMFLACVSFAAIALTACTSIVTSDGANGVPQPASDHPGYDAVFSLKNDRVEGESQINVLFGLFSWGADGYADNSQLSTFSFLPSSENFAKSAAVYNTCQANKADVLVGTRYVLTITDYFVFKKINCKVAGFPATMTGATEKKPYVLPDGSMSWLSQAPTVVK